MDPQDINNSMYKRDESKKKKTSLEAESNEELCSEDDNEQYIKNLSIVDLDSRVKKYNTLYLENKINVLNAFDIDLISCVQQIVKRSKETDILGISNTFDAISKVYSCRVDDILMTGNKLFKEFVSETKSKKLAKENETKTKQKYRKKLMLTTPDKLRCKDNQMLRGKNYLSVDLDNDMIDYAKPSRLLINRYSNNAYWPEYRVSENTKANENEQETYYEMENLSFLIEEEQICPSFHKFIAEFDKSTNSDDEIDINKLDNIQTHFNQETSAFCTNNSEESDDAMDEDLKKTSSEIIVHTDPGSSNQNNNQFGRLENLDSLSQILSMVDINDSSDYTFFDRKQLRKFECPNHWKAKFDMMNTDSKQKAMLIKSRVDETHSKTNVPESKHRNSRAITYKVDFYSDLSTKLENLRLNSDKNYCSYTKWKSSNNLIPSSGQLNTIPIRQFESCKFINMIPNWYKHEFEKSNLNLNPNSLFLFPGQDILRDRLVDEVPVENTDCIGSNVMDTNHFSKCGNENDDDIETEINDNNLTIALNQKNTLDDAYKEYSTCNSGNIDMHQLKKYIMNIVKPDDEKPLNISFTDLLLRLPRLLPDNMKEIITVSVIYVALLHLCNEHSLCLEDKNGEIFIIQDSAD